ncbi:MAG: PQQ-dependent sugar dehydrogenase, partial [Candidatus Shapirobacteria bacterium]|nr:PQQ-dependent sugar dehydrogenase [Candidatus Shapirobacteria bacterium]
MKKLIIFLIIIVVLWAGFFWVIAFNKNLSPQQVVLEQDVLAPDEEGSRFTVIAEGLETPWSIVFLPDKSILVTERPGRVRLIDTSDNLQQEPIITINNVTEIGEGGLLGITLHPDFITNGYVYLYYTYSGNGNDTLNRVVRMTYQNGQLGNEQTIINNI